MKINRKYLLKFLNILLTFYVFNLSSAETKESETKIHNGNSAIGHRYLKHMVTVTFANKFCGGTIITSRVILTAAHCVTDNNYPKHDYKAEIVAGTALRSPQLSPTAQIREVGKIYVHSGFKKELDPNDIAVLILRKPLVEDGKIVESVQLADHRTAEGTFCEIIGWGYINCGNKLNATTLVEHAQYTALSIVSDAFCENTLRRAVRPGEICVKDPNDNTMPCAGDSGSPLICGGRVVGVQSTSTNLIGIPTIFTEVVYFRNWIENIITQDYNEESTSINAQLGTTDLCNIPFWLSPLLVFLCYNIVQTYICI